MFQTAWHTLFYSLQNKALQGEVSIQIKELLDIMEYIIDFERELVKKYQGEMKEKVKNEFKQ